MSANLPPFYNKLLQQAIYQNVVTALCEDIHTGDLTSRLAACQPVRSRIITRESIVMCGQPWFNEVFRQIDPDVEICWQVQEGELLQAGDELAQLFGPSTALLTGERCALNFLQTLSGCATTVASYVQSVQDYPCQIAASRKTIPGLRYAQKYAVFIASAETHRWGLFDGILIKENHIATSSISELVKHARKVSATLSSPCPVQVEIEHISQLHECIQAQVDIVLLDNMTPEQVATAVELRESLHADTILEVSGNINLDNICSYAKLGVERISVGALTKHLRAADLSMGVIKED